MRGDAGAFCLRSFPAPMDSEEFEECTAALLELMDSTDALLASIGDLDRARLESIKEHLGTIHRRVNQMK